MKKRFQWFVIGLCTCICSCQPSKQIAPQIAAYHWKSIFSWQSKDDQKAQQMGLEKLYIKFFDVKPDPTQRAQPAAALDVQTPFPDSIEIVPVVYITQACLQQLDESLMPWLAERIHEKIDEIWQLARGKYMHEVQWDCDWTASTQSKYFILISELKKLFPETIHSCTLRLYPFRYPSKMGVPPVDRAMLMYYNMGQLKTFEESNSILNNETALTYLKPAGPYPLPLDIALPAFSWGVAFRDEQFLGLMRDLNTEVVEGSGFFANFASNSYRSMKDTVWRGIYIRTGDVIRVEEVTSDALREAVHYTAPLLDPSGATLSLFQWHAPHFISLANEDLHSILTHFD